MKLEYEVIAAIYVFGQTPSIQTDAYICMYVSYCKEHSNDKHPIIVVLDLQEAHIYNYNHCLKKQCRFTVTVQLMLVSTSVTEVTK